jgi:antitoxin (DNA-binding transcriptional repressor) of toxin-antitoxin stability system
MRNASVTLGRMNLTLEEMKKDLDGVIDRIREGETLVLTDADRPIAEIRPIDVLSRPRPFGMAKGTFTVADDFEDPLPEELIRDFER